jgi:hypothetical protein
LRGFGRTILIAEYASLECTPKHILGWGYTSAQNASVVTDVAEDTTQLQNAVRSFLSAMEPEESVAFASLVYFYSGRYDVRYNVRIVCASN